jgi:uncharacterized protein DUF222
MHPARVPFESALEEIVRERRELDAGEATWLAHVAEYAVSGGWAADSYLGAAAAIADHCHMTRAAAAAAVRLAVKLLQLPELAATFAAGDTSRSHVEVVARAYTRDRAAELDEHQTALSFLARNATPEDLHKVVARLVDAIDGDGGAGNDDAIYEKRHVHSSQTMGGVRGSWFLDGEGGTIVNAALDAHLVTARMADDKRSLTQRRADALVDICRFSLAYGEHPPHAAKRRRGVPNLLVVADIRTFSEEYAQVVAELRAEYATGGRVSQAGIERLLCDSDVCRVLLDGPSEVLDLGRTTRTPSDSQFKALVVRDGHCQGKGCKVPWQFCQPHHSKWWTREGNTDLANLQLLCWHHHRETHKHQAKARDG